MATKIEGNGSIFLTEKSESSLDVTGHGQVWVKDDIPNTLMFTDDIGLESQLGTKLGIEIATTSGTAIDFTGIPSGIKNIEVMFNDVSTDGLSGSPKIIQLAGSGNIETTGYVSTGGAFTSSITILLSTVGFIIHSLDGGDQLHGVMIFKLQNLSTNAWVSSHNMTLTSNEGKFGAGSKSILGELTRLRITTISGSEEFTGGSINIQFS